MENANGTVKTGASIQSSPDNRTISSARVTCMLELGVAGRRLWEKPRRTVFLHISPWNHPNASLPQSFADRVYRD